MIIYHFLYPTSNKHSQSIGVINLINTLLKDNELIMCVELLDIIFKGKINIFIK